MVNHISISNFAIIENTEIDFNEGLNIITGETGAGKSIVIEAISLALGSRADSGLVRHGAEKAIVQLAGQLDGEEIVITREVSSSGKNLCKLNGQLVTLGQLTETCKKMTDIHGQYDNQSLLNPENHIKLVDSFHNNKIFPIKENFKKIYLDYQGKKSKLNKLISLERENTKKLDFYKFEKSEIDNASLTNGEDDQLTEKISLLQNSEKIFEGLETAYTLLNDEDSSAMNKLGNSLRSIQSLTEYSKEIESISEEFSDLYYRLEDISSNMRDLKEKITFTPEELDNAILRLNLIDNLKKKYGSTIEEILEYRDKISLELEQIENYDDVKADLEHQVKENYSALKNQANLLTEARKLSASQLQSSIEKELRELNFTDANLIIDFKEPDEIGQDGNDIIEIFIATNKGEPPKPLVKVASGGEISRIMLAIKNITGTYDNIPTMIFDEIDTGISGITASIVSRKLREISKNHQIICITHLPQIAAAGDYNYRIFKESDESSTYTHVERLSSDEKIDEIARLLGGDKITETTRKSAMELIENK